MYSIYFPNLTCNLPPVSFLQLATKGTTVLKDINLKTLALSSTHLSSFPPCNQSLYPNSFLHLPFCSVLTATAPGLGPHYLSSRLLQWLPN